MPVITPESIRRLARFRGQRAPVTSCYLDVDGKRLRRQQDVEQELDVLLRRVRTKGNSKTSVHDDFHRISNYVRGGFDRSGVRGLAIFACSAHALWEVVPLPVPVRSQVVVNSQPAVGQLKSVMEEYDAFGVLLVDRKRARLFLFELGELVEHSELFDDQPRDYDVRGEKERGDVAKHVDALAQAHARRAASAAFRMWQHHPFNRLAIGGPDDVVHEVRQALHPYLRERSCTRMPLPVTAKFEDIRNAAIELEQRVERAKEAAMVARLREAIGSNGRGVAGLAPTLRALAERRVDRLLVSDGYTEPGWRCEPCGWLAVKGRKCPVCANHMVEIDDVVEAAVEEALAQSCAVEVCVGNADLDVLGRIGALLRF